DVTTLTTTGTLTLSNLGSHVNYEVYVVSKDCSGVGDFWQRSELVYAATGPAGTVCAPVPTIDFVRSNCAVQIEVGMHSNAPTANNQFVVFTQRLTPTIAAVKSYTVTGGYFQLNVGAPGQTFLVAVASKCSSGGSDMVIFPGGITIKELCAATSNLVLSSPTCNGFTASWNRDNCLENTLSYYALSMRKVGALTWSSYNVTSPIAPISPYKKVNWLGKGVTMECFVRSIYQCNGYTTSGPASTIETISTLTSGCREEAEEQITAEEPTIQIISADNSEMVSLYPNPNSGQFMIDISRLSNEEDQVKVEVMNLVGQTVLTNISTVTYGHLNEYINLPESTTTGTYFVRVTVGTNVYTTKVN